MGLRTPRQIALLIAALCALAVGLALVIVSELGGRPVPWSLISITVMMMGVLMFAASFYLIDRFVQKRVDMIHRAILDTQTGRNVPKGDALKMAEADVSAWASERHTEITELKEREQFRREFIGNLAHELRTPIFNVQGYILTLLEGGLEDPKVNRVFLDRASNGTDRLIRIVEDLDMITQLESGVMSMTVEPLDLNIPLNEMITSLEMTAREKRFTLINGLEEHVMVQADRGRLAQVYSNLFVNAISYGEAGGVCTVRSFDLGDHVLVEVTDDGIGIAEEHLPRLFERFYRVTSSRARNEGGSGLGLAIVKHIIEALGGTIAVKSAVGKGTTFSITLPKAK